MNAEQIKRFNELFASMSISRIKRLQGIKEVDEYEVDDEDSGYDDTAHIIYDEVLGVHFKIVERLDSYGENQYINSITIVEPKTKTVTTYE